MRRSSFGKGIARSCLGRRRKKLYEANSLTVYVNVSSALRARANNRVMAPSGLVSQAGIRSWDVQSRHIFIVCPDASSAVLVRGPAKGFAVVANEVKELAKKTAKANKRDSAVTTQAQARRARAGYPRQSLDTRQAIITPTHGSHCWHETWPL